MIGPHIIMPTPAGLAWAHVATGVKALHEVTALTLAPPDALRVYRHYFADQPLDVAPEHLAAAILTDLGGYRHPRLYVQTYNERYGRTGSGLEAYADLQASAIPLLHAAGVKALAMTWSTGDYDEADWAYMRSRAWCGADAIAVNAYWGNAGLTYEHALKFTRYWQPGEPPVIITECGRDAVEGGGRGWKASNVSGSQYVQEIRAYALELARLGYVLGGFLFTSGPTPDWADFSADELVPELITALHGISGGQSPPEEEKVPTVHDLYDRWAKHFSEGFNATTSIGRYMAATLNGGVPLGNERRETIEGVDCVVQDYAMGLAICPVVNYPDVKLCRNEAEIAAHVEKYRPKV